MSATLMSTKQPVEQSSGGGSLASLEVMYLPPVLTKVELRRRAEEAAVDDKAQLAVEIIGDVKRVSRTAVDVSLSAIVEGHPRFELEVTYQTRLFVEEREPLGSIRSIDRALQEGLTELATPLLYPYVRHFVSTLALQAAGQTFLLPPLDPKSASDAELPPFVEPEGADAPASENNSRPIRKRKSAANKKKT